MVTGMIAGFAAWARSSSCKACSSVEQRHRLHAGMTPAAKFKVFRPVQGFGD
jgi:hypothetical protein